MNVQLNIQLSQGSAATKLRGGGKFYSSFTCGSYRNTTVKELLKLVHICQSYPQNITCTFFYGPWCICSPPCACQLYLTVLGLCLFCDYQNCGSRPQANHNFPDISRFSRWWPLWITKHHQFMLEMYRTCPLQCSAEAEYFGAQAERAKYFFSTMNDVWRISIISKFT